ARRPRRCAPRRDLCRGHRVTGALRQKSEKNLQFASTRRDSMIHHRLQITSYGAVAALALAAFATGARAQAAKVDVDEHRTTPVGHRYIHGTLGDADFQMALPDTW